jgi:hypothetical protein
VRKGAVEHEVVQHGQLIIIIAKHNMHPRKRERTEMESRREGPGEREKEKELAIQA